jgi:DGQHR domain-containing protein
VPVNGHEQTGHLKLDLGTTFDVGDGQHRLAAIRELVSELRDHELDDPLRQRIYGMRIPLLIVKDNDPVRRAQDFVDLQRHAKPPAGSLGASMDRRHAINRFTLDVAKKVALLDGGSRIEFQSDTVGKKSSKLYSFQAFRQGVGILLVGSAERTRAGWEAAADAALTNGQYDAELDRVTGLLDDLAYTMRGWAELMDGSTTPTEFRAQYLHATAAGFYAICLALYDAQQASLDMSKAVRRSRPWTRIATR